MVDSSIISGLYLYDSIQTNVGGKWSATETTHKIIQIDFRHKLVKCFYSEQKAIKTKMDLTYKDINNTDNALLILVRAVIYEVILRKVGYRMTPTHKKYR